MSVSATSTGLGFRRRTTLSPDEAIVAITDALKPQGFGILTKIDVKETLKQKLGVEVDPYTILGACNPQLAHQAVETEPELGLLLPCNVVVRRDAQGTIVEVVDPVALLGVVNNPTLEPVAQEARERLARALEALPA